MKKLVYLGVVFVTFFVIGSCLGAHEAAAASNCEKFLTLQLIQNHHPANGKQPIPHGDRVLKDHWNSIVFKLPVTCKFFNETQVGDNLLMDKFRNKSLLIKGAIGSWELTVITKD